MPKKPGKQSSADKRHVQYNNAIVQFGSADTADAQSELQTHLCGMSRKSFYRAVARAKESAGCGA